ncbi:melanocyte-stimulating hormone receptor-like [Stylophora pistillata]|uniref:melanocyte-stimulating hormone receptor-like n=1 Tax=Stylophora pistillata TaxID=50429 RepID=UPI000C0522A8|nr:melanocyte-stimulating hormone receptor-like [Stylophora pistillata]
MKNGSENGEQTVTFQDLRCPAGLTREKHEHLIYLSVFNIFLSVVACVGNVLILVALSKESSLHLPSKLLFRCLATTDLCVGIIVEPLNIAYIMTLVYEDWRLCRFLEAVSFKVGYLVAAVSLLTLTAISLDRLLALLLGSSYRQIVTCKRTYVVIASIWVYSGVATASYLKSYLITFWCGRVTITLCVIISIISYTKIFVSVRRQQMRVHFTVQQHEQQQSNHSFSLYMLRYRKAVYSALWVQLALGVCYLPYSIMTILIGDRRPPPSYFLAWLTTVALVYFNSSLNPLLYCWKMSEVRRAMKEIIRYVFCCT